MTLTVQRVETQRQLRDLIKIPWEIYRDDPNWVPPLYTERQRFFDRAANPFFQHAEADYFLARRDGRAVGRIAAILNTRHNDFHGAADAHFGAFEVEHDSEAAAALLEAACDWARERGAERVLGPANFASNNEWGILTDGFDSPPVVMMTYNPGYYGSLVEANGFSKAMDLYSWNVPVEQYARGHVPAKFERVLERTRKRANVEIRCIDPNDFDAEFERIRQIYNGAWEANWGFVPLSDAELDHLARELKPIIDPDIVLIAEVGGTPIGFSFSIPDFNALLHQVRPGPSRLSSYWSLLRLGMVGRRHQPRRIRTVSLGVLPEYRATGVGALLVYETAVRGGKKGAANVDASWVLEINDPMNRFLELLGGDVWKRHRVYEKRLTNGTATA